MARRRCDREDVQNRGEVGMVVQELGGVARNYQAAGLKFNFLVEKKLPCFFSTHHRISAHRTLWRPEVLSNLNRNSIISGKNSPLSKTRYATADTTATKPQLVASIRTPRVCRYSSCVLDSVAMPCCCFENYILIFWNNFV